MYMQYIHCTCVGCTWLCMYVCRSHVISIIHLVINHGSIHLPKRNWTSIRAAMLSTNLLRATVPPSKPWWQSLDLKTLAVHRGALAVSSMQNGPLAFFEPSRCWRTSLAWLRWFSALGPGIPPRSDMKHLTWLLVWSPYLENRVKCRNYFHKDDKLKMYKQDSITQLYIHVAHEKRKSGTVASAT